jgi:hypothetical protein
MGYAGPFDGKRVARNRGARVDKLLGLELLRFTVRWPCSSWHFQHFAMAGDGAAMRQPHEPLGLLLWPLYHLACWRAGLLGHQRFIFFWKYGDAIAARRIEAKRFFWLRFSRLYPLHFATLLASRRSSRSTSPWPASRSSIPTMGRSISCSSSVWLPTGADRRLQLQRADLVGVGRSVRLRLFFLLLRIFGTVAVADPRRDRAGTGKHLERHLVPDADLRGYFFAGGAAAEWMQSARARRRPREAVALALGWIAAAVAVAMVTGLDRFNPVMPTC